MSLGQKMAKNETNELCESKSKDNWKYDVVIQFITLNINKVDTPKKATELAKDLGLESQDLKYWKEVVSTIKSDFNKDDAKKKAAKKVRTAASSYGCGGSYDYNYYGCGGSSSSRSSSSSYGCGGSSSNYGC